jgi:hypothetical protein
MTQIYTKMTHPTLTTQMRTLAQTDRDLQIAITQEIGMAVITIYQWAKYYPERLARNRAALKVIIQFMEENKIKARKNKQ